MLDNFMFQINSAMVQAGAYAYFAAFIWGIMSVIFSPCHLASIPLVVAYIGGFTENKKVKHAFFYSSVFSGGLFLSIAAIGIITSMIGRMLGDVGKIWNIIVGFILIVVSLHLFGAYTINLPGLNNLRTSKKGTLGAFLLGLTYGIISGPCTFGFIAPMLAMIALQDTMIRGIWMIVLFAVGHCLPILAGGSATTFVNKITGSDTLQKSGSIFKKIAGGIFILIGIYIMIK